MPHRRWVQLTRAAAAAGLAVFAAYTLLAPADDRLFTFFNTWVYDGLMVLACVIVGSHAYLVARDRVAWTVITVALGCWTFGELWYAIFKPETYPSMADLGYIAFYPLLYVGIVLLLRSRARSIGGTLWLDGITAALTAAALGAAILVELVLEGDRGLDLDRRHEPRVPARRRAPALGRLRCLLAHGRTARPPLAPPRPRCALDGARRFDLPLPVGRGHVRRGDVDRHPLADRAPAHRFLRLDARSNARGSRGRGSTAARRPGGLRARRDRHPRLRPLHSGQPARDRPRVGGARARRGAPRGHVPGEQPSLRADPRRRRRRTR